MRDDSRAVARGDLFVATRGQTVDGHDFLGAAAARGAVAAVVDADAAQGFPGVRVRVEGAARALATIAANRWGRPADAMTMIAVTGTNGKTTTTFLVEGLVRAAGGVPGRDWYRRVPLWYRPVPGAVHHADPAGAARDARRDARCRRHPRGDGGQLARARARAARRRALSRGRVHQPDPGSPRLSRHDAGVRRVQGQAVPRAPDRRRRRRHQHGQRVGRVHAAGGARPRPGGGGRAACPRCW